MPKLLRQLELKGHTVSLDAMECQKKIAQEIYFAGADYLLALKGNHGTRHDEVFRFFSDPEALVAAQKEGFVLSGSDETNGGHGRVERVLVPCNERDQLD